MINLSLSKLAANLETPFQHPDISFEGISTDTRRLQPGNLFIALDGENFDGHDFIEEAQKKGACAALVKRKTACSLPQILVPNPVKAMGTLAYYWRKQFNIPVIGLTGTNGKTTLKNMVASILRAFCQKEDAVLATEANFNNHIGVPLLLTQLNANHRFVVVEMGMNHFGEIEYLTNMVNPTVAIINNAALAHLRGVSNLEGVAKAKGEIFQGLAADGIGILNHDDPFYTYWKGLLGNRTSISFGLKEGSDVSVRIHQQEDPLKQSLTLFTPEGSIDILLPLLAQHNVFNALAASTVALALKVDLASIKKGLENVKSENGRLQLHQFKQNIRLIDDTYNANPVSLKAGLNVLAQFEGRKVFVLGDMRDFGEHTADIHASVSDFICNAKIDHLFTYGEYTSEISKKFGKNAYHFSDQSILIAALKSHLLPATTFLIKGSRKMKMEKVVAALSQELGVL